MSRWAPASRLLAAFTTGLAVAIWLFPVIAGPRVQQLRLERDQAMARVEALQAEVVKLKEADRKQPGQAVVLRARAEVEAPDQRVALEAGHRIQKELAEEQVGRRIEEISFLLLYSRYQGRLLAIDGIRYQVTVRALVIGPEVALYGEVHPVD